jgi:beta-phosphoglucomutase
MPNRMPQAPIISPMSWFGPHASLKQFIKLNQTSDMRFSVGTHGVQYILATQDRKVEFVCWEDVVLAHVTSALECHGYYPVRKTQFETPVMAVLMDLDGTSVRSEEFWIWIIEQTTASLLGNPKFELEDVDIPHVSGHSVSEHLSYCINKYCPDKTLEQARKFYFQHTHYEMNEISQGRGRQDAFKPTPGLKDFLMDLKSRGIKIGLVTSGLYEKAWPEILSAFKTMHMGDPNDFYDAIITAGFPFRQGQVGTLGELSPKPHPWLYAEVCRIGLGIDADDDRHVIGIEDSGAGVCSILLAGFPVIGMAGGNIKESGTLGLCHHYCHHFKEVSAIIARP